MKLEEIKKLAELARIEMTDDEMLSMAGDFGPILAYVGQVQEASGLSSIQNTEGNFLLNVTREDVVTNEPNSSSKKIMNEMPETQDGFLKVKQIL